MTASKEHCQFGLNPLMPGGTKKVTYTSANLQAAGLFKYL